MLSPFSGSCIIIGYVVYNFFYGWSISTNFRLSIFVFITNIASLGFIKSYGLSTNLLIEIEHYQAVVTALVLLTQLPIMMLVDFFPAFIFKLRGNGIVNIFKKIFDISMVFIIFLAIAGVIISVIIVSYIFITKYFDVYLDVKYFSYFSYFIILLTSALFSFRFLKHFRVCYFDEKIKRSIKLSNRITRKEIVKHFNEFKTERYKIVFIQMLANKKTIAIGEWPEDFSLNALNNQAITRLARLEEKWLGLDR